jgi:hypothetical protein
MELGMADISLRVTRKLYPWNKDPALGFEDMLTEILLKLNEALDGKPGDEALMWEIARRKGLDLLTYHNRRAHPSLNEHTGDGEGNTIERGELVAGSEGFEDEALLRIAIERNIPERIVKIGWKRVRRIALSAAERKRLERFRKSSHFSVCRELLGRRVHRDSGFSGKA